MDKKQPLPEQIIQPLSILYVYHQTSPHYNKHA